MAVLIESILLVNTRAQFILIGVILLARLVVDRAEHGAGLPGLCWLTLCREL